MSAATIHTPVFDRGRRGSDRYPARTTDAIIIVMPPARADVVATGPRSRAPARSALRLTRRGRLVLTMAILAVGVVLALVGARAASAGSSAPAVVAPQSVTVQPGQSLWQIASAAVPGADVRDVIIDIKELNGMGSSALSAGQVLRLPSP